MIFFIVIMMTRATLKKGIGLRSCEELADDAEIFRCPAAGFGWSTLAWPQARYGSFGMRIDEPIRRGSCQKSVKLV
jgi:hypothetical protein